MTSDDDADMRTLERWIEARWPVASDLRLERQGAPGSGFSAETTILTATWSEAGEPRSGRFVLRREVDGPAVYPAQATPFDVEIELQHRVMAALLDSTDLPLAPVVGYESDASVLGAPFYVMEFVEGAVPVEDPMYTLAGFFTELEPGQRTTMIEDGLRALAEVHAVDWEAAGLQWLVPEGVRPTALRQVDIWESYGDQELRGRIHPPLDRAFAWLRANPPVESTPGLCWGDPRPGNIIWSDDRVACLTDWEAAFIGPPELDLGWWLMFDRWSNETCGPDQRLPGDPTRDEQKAMYEKFAGYQVRDMVWYELFAAVRYAVIVVRVMNRWVDNGDLPEDHTLWFDNPVAPCLDQLLAEAEAEAETDGTESGAGA